jgi:hypothetical protein
MTIDYTLTLTLIHYYREVKTVFAIYLTRILFFISNFGAKQFIDLLKLI